MFRISRSSRPLSRPFSSSCCRPAGHNKWSKIKDKKGANDLQKSIVYSRTSHEILTAIRIGASVDPALNMQLATALKKAKELGVPKENIEKALARAAGGKEGRGSRLIYEALVSDSIGLIIECCTDNANRTLHNVREILTSRGARLTPVKFMFEHLGRVAVSIRKSGPTNLVDKIMDLGIDNMATEMHELGDMETDDYKVMEFLCQPENLGRLEGGIREDTKDTQQVSILFAELAFVPRDVQNIDGAERQKVKDLVHALEADSDTLKVYTSTNVRT